VTNLDRTDEERIVVMRGEIKPGDANRLEAFFRQRVPKPIGSESNDYFSVLSLNSPGGDFAEGLKIAHFPSQGGHRHFGSERQHLRFGLCAGVPWRFYSAYVSFDARKVMDALVVAI
jgi:hypothetical protein